MVAAAIQQELSTGIDRVVRAARKESVDKPKVPIPKTHDRRVPAPSVVLQQYKVHYVYGPFLERWLMVRVSSVVLAKVSC